MKLFAVALLAANLFTTSFAAPHFGRDNGGAAPAGKPYVRLNKDDAAMVVVDHQTGLTSLVRDIDMALFHQNVLAISDTAKFFKLPTVLTTSRDDGPNGPMIPEIIADHPDVQVVRRPGQINAWDSEEFVAAVKATGRKQLIVSGIVTEVCVAFVTLSAIEAGYQVFVVADASGTSSQLVRDASWSRMEAAGAQIMTFFGVACELARDWRTDLAGLADFFGKHIPEYKSVIDSYNGAQAAAKAGSS